MKKGLAQVKRTIKAMETLQTTDDMDKEIVRNINWDQLQRCIMMLEAIVRNIK